MLRQTLRCLATQDNRVSKLNARGQAADRLKWSKREGASQGIPQKPRLEMTRISVIHESKNIIIAGRNRCNNFNSNQYLLASKRSKQAVLVDMSDDWPDDWHAFIEEAGFKLKAIFFTHMHVDNLIGLAPFLAMHHQRHGQPALPNAAQRRDRSFQARRALRYDPETELPIGFDGDSSTSHGSDSALSSSSGATPPLLRLAWNPSDRYWVEKYPAACVRYGRQDMARSFLPFNNPADPRLMPLSSNTNRTATFIDLEDPHDGVASHVHALAHGGDGADSDPGSRYGTQPLFYIHTPGHSMGHMMLHVPQEKLLFTGDALLYDRIGRVDLPYATGSLLAQSLRSLEDLPDSTAILPGHGRLSTLGRERKNNKGLQRLYELMSSGRSIPNVGFNDGGFL